MALELYRSPDPIALELDHVPQNAPMMKRKVFLLILTMACMTSHAQKWKTIYIRTNLPISFKAYIDSVLQYSYESSKLIIHNVPAGEKSLQIKILVQNNPILTTKISPSADREVFYQIEKLGASYVLNKNQKGDKEKFEGFIQTGYAPKPSAGVRDTSSRPAYTCRVSDSLLNNFVMNLAVLKSTAARKDYVLSYMKRKCLYTHQLKSIGYRIDNDQARMDIYKALFLASLDSNKYLDLVSSFQSQKFGDLFIEWFKQQN